MAIGERGQLKVKGDKESMPLVDMVAIVAEVRIWRGLPAVRKTLGHDSDGVKALWSQSIYIYILQYIVDNTGRHDIDFGREGLIHGLDLFGH